MDVACAVNKVSGRVRLNSGSVEWLPISAGTPLSIKLADVQGMKATPPTAAKLRIKLNSNDGRTMMLEFADSAGLEVARKELQSAIKEFRGQPGAQPAPTSTEQTESTPVSESTPSGSQTPNPPKKSSKKISLEPARLLQNLELQRLVLRQDPELMRTFQQVVISAGALSNEQFWSLRIHLLVTAAQQQLQMRGSYNVLSTIKPTTGSDNRVNINLTREKITDVFDQYPLVRKAYNDNVPKLSEGEFWQRFFMSKLFLVLRGEKVAQNHPPDTILDPYIDTLNSLQEKQKAQLALKESQHPAPLFINVEANAENNPETYGNDILVTAGKGTRGLISSMNGLSHRLLLGKNKQREMLEPFQPSDMGTMDSELRLNDLAGEQRDDNEIGINLRLDDALPIHTRSSGNPVQYAIELEKQAPSRISLDSALDSILDGSAKSAESLVLALTPHQEATQVSTDIVVSSEVQLTQITSLEFLRQFWHAYAKSPEDAAPLREYLSKSKERIQALGESNKLLQPLLDSLDSALRMHS